MIAHAHTIAVSVIFYHYMLQNRHLKDTHYAV